MFLLIQNPEVNSSYYFTYFTFHNVSINTENPDVSGVDFQNFTFHDVSINTLSSTHSKSRVVPLHSTMFLLIQKTGSATITATYLFTFHDVSINTSRQYQEAQYLLDFTFHDVSINTGVTSRTAFLKHPLHSTMFLLILMWSCLLLCVSCSLHSTMFLLILRQISFFYHPDIPLHSTMFLLIPAGRSFIRQSSSLYIPRCFY